VSLVQRFLAASATRLGLEGHGVKGTPSCILLTPRFMASRHVVVLVLGTETGRPCLVAKLPRLRDDDAGIQREAANLRQLERARVGGDPGVPRVLALERFEGQAILLETALAGRPMDRAAVRSDPGRCLAAVVEWTGALPSTAPAERHAGRYEELLAGPLRRAGGDARLPAEWRRLVERTLELVAPLRDVALPLVFEHGDLSDPNLLWLDGGRVGVVDWELSEPHGLPAHDLCFFLAFVAVATARARRLTTQVRAFHDAFVRPGGWARPLLAAHADRLQVRRSLLAPLLVACWARYTLGVLSRLWDEGEQTGLPVDERSYRFWRHAVAHAETLRWADRG
jgi:hypothetical protein